MKAEERPGEPGVFVIHSGKRNYTVDLFELKGNGICSCHDFTIRCFKNWQESGRTIMYGSISAPRADRTICKHIQFARLEWSNELLKTLWAEHRQKGIES